MKQRFIWLDYLRAIAAILVVLLHTSAPYLYEIQTIDVLSWLVGNFVDSFTRVSVPLFFMISGYLFFGKRKPTLKNYIRIISALAFYSFISLLYLKLYRGVQIYGLVKDIAFTPVFYHLWFFYTILTIYIICSFLTVRDIAGNRVIFLIIICFFIINPKLSNLTSLVDITYKSGMWLDGNTVYYILYAAFGAILGNIQLNNNRFMLILLAPFLYFLSSVIIGYTTFIVSTNAGKYVGTFYHYNGVLVAIGAFSIFVFIKENARNMSLLDRPLNIIARNSLAIYGIHALILDFIYRQGYRDFYNPLIDIPLVFIITILLSLLIAITFKRLDKYNMIT